MAETIPEGIETEVPLLSGLVRREQTLYHGEVNYRANYAGWYWEGRDVSHNLADKLWPEHWMAWERPERPSVTLDLHLLNPDPPRDLRECWLHLQGVWEWCRQHCVYDPRKIREFRATVKGWPRLRDYIDWWQEHKNIPWGTCGSRTQLFCLLASLVDIEPWQIAWAESRYKPSKPNTVPKHQYPIFFLPDYGWLYLDPSFMSSRRLENTPHSSGGHPTCDYKHPSLVVPFPGSRLDFVPLVQRK